MKIINREEFLRLPENTLYSKYTPYIIEKFEIKGESTEYGDFYSQQIVDGFDECEYSKALEYAEQNGSSVKMYFYCPGRDDCMNEDQLFAVWDNEDVLALIERLKLCVKYDD